MNKTSYLMLPSSRLRHQRQPYTELGSALTETSIVIALIALVAFPSLKVLGTQISQKFEQSSNEFGVEVRNECSYDNPAACR